MDLMKSHTIAENIYELMKLVVESGSIPMPEGFKRLTNIAYLCFDYAEHLGIDLEWHIEAKLQYNKTRSFRHGNKKY